ncbi:hypothetical protein HDV57DRAFT_485599 [Trichoderma longibrachiatum]|uniref:Uncharacterized protein n=1 Tax=Trichoderma longibrachiatum ATCC 18648 TaxID=983965 RepID=A0A2T4CCC9_TRILO|nr:hypothetical protein M440DRAFT_232088 [Trichoderma longibrachiatum ATCC 18648]
MRAEGQLDDGMHCPDSPLDLRYVGSSYICLLICGLAWVGLDWREAEQSLLSLGSRMIFTLLQVQLRGLGNGPMLPGITVQFSACCCISPVSQFPLIQTVFIPQIRMQYLLFTSYSHMW